ncbi:ATP-binding cassette domain-containing protein [Catenulispora yoronensis]
MAFGGLTALDGVSLSVPRGRVVGVIGPAGAGKTTMLDVVCGRVRPTSGEVLVRGISLHGHRPQQLASLGVARTLQRLGLFSHLTVAENVMAGAVRMPRAGFLPTLLALPAPTAASARYEPGPWQSWTASVWPTPRICCPADSPTGTRSGSCWHVP